MSKSATVLLSATDATKLIASIKGRGAKLDKDIHQAALSAIDNHAKHGNMSLINGLVLAMPKSGRANALVAWILAFDPMVMKNPAKDAAQPLVHNRDGVGAVDIDKADETPFWEFKAQEGVSVFSFDSYITSLTKGIDKALAQPDLSEEQIARLKGAKAAALAVVGV